MKAVVVEIRDKYVAALSSDGRIYKIKNNDYNIGQEIEIKKYLVNNNRFIKTVATVAASIMLFVAPAWAYFTPYSYVSLDVNPSVEYSVNIFDRVLSVIAVNDDGENVLKEIDLDELKNKNIEVAVQEVLTGIIEAGFLEEDQEGGIVIAASSKSDEKSQILADKLKSKVEEQVNEKSIESKVKVEAIGVGEERVQEAKELGVTPGKLNLVEKLQESSENPDDIIVEDWLKKPVKEIMKETKKNNKIEKKEDKKTEKTEDKKYNSESDEASINYEKTSEVKGAENEKKLKNDKSLDNEDNENKHLENDDESDEDSKSEEEKKKSEEEEKSKKEKQNSAEKEHNDNKKIKPKSKSN